LPEAIDSCWQNFPVRIFNTGVLREGAQQLPTVVVSDDIALPGAELLANGFATDWAIATV